MGQTTSSSGTAIAGAPAAFAAGDGGDAARVAAVCNRLRAVQADFADAPPLVRQRYLADEIQRALKDIVPDQRPAFLAALERQFPAWEAPASAAAPVQQITTETDQRELQDPSYLVRRLCEMTGSMSDEQRQVVIRHLDQAGLLPPAGVVPWPDDLMQAMRAKLQVGEQKRIDPIRLLEVMVGLVDFASTLQQLASQTWRTLAPNSEIRPRAGTLQGLVAKYASGDPSASRQQVNQELERLRQLLASLIAAVGDAGRQVASTFTSRFSPNEIKTAAASEGGMFVSVEAKCWRKFVELWDAQDEHALEMEVRDAIAKFTESLMKGLGR